MDRPDIRRASLTLPLLALLVWPAWASESEQLSVQLDQLRAEIQAIQGRLDADLASRDGLRLELAQAERAVAEAERARLATRQLLTRSNARIASLDQRIADLSRQAEALSELLGAQLRLAYQQGGQSALKLLLNLEDPRRLPRQMSYHGYLSRARLVMLAELHGLRQQLDADLAALGVEQQELGTLEARQGQELAASRAAQAERDQAIRRLQSSIESQEALLARRMQDAAELEQLIEQLARALRDIPMAVEVPSIVSLQGQLPRPVRGRLRRGFGDPRGSELRWNGWLIEAEAGSEVRAIAHGRVAFADWLRGYGMLLIIDHGDGVMSLYGHNQSLLRQVGDWVSQGERIATVGASGGGEPGLYFEMRRAGQPINPSGWLVSP